MTTYPLPIQTLEDERVAVVGTSGSGKTYAAKGAVEVLLESRHRVGIIDPLGVWWGLKSSADGNKPGFPVVVFGGRHADVPIAEASGVPLGTLLARQTFSWIVDISELGSGAARRRFMTSFLEALHHENHEPLTLVIDEADMFAPQKPLPDGLLLLNRVDEIVRRGRIRGFVPWLISQRPAVLNKDVLSQADALIAMKLTSPQDRKALGDWINGQADASEAKELLADLPKLERGAGYVWAPAHGLLKRVAFPRIKTFDSSRTPKRGETIQRPQAAARIDIDKLRQEFAIVEDQAAENDVSLLRKKVATLQDRLDAIASGPDPITLDAEYQRGVRDGRKDVNLGAMRARITQLRAYVEKISAELDELFRAALEPNTENPRLTDAEIDKIKAQGPGRVLEINKLPVFTKGPGVALGKPERAILTALAQLGGSGPRNRVALMAGYSAQGGAFKNPLSRLRTTSRVTNAPNGDLAITDQGLSDLGPYKPMPRPGAALVRAWMERLGSPERKILEAMLEAGGGPISRHDVATKAGYEANGGAFKNPLSRLRTLGLIEGSSDLKLSTAVYG